MPVTAAPSVTVSPLAPPVSVSTFLTVSVLAKSPSVRLSEPPARSTVPAVTAVPSVTVSALAPPVTVSTLADRDRVGEGAQGQAVGATGQIDRAGRSSRCRE